MKTYTEGDLRNLVALIDNAYRAYTRDNFQGDSILEEFLKEDNGKEVIENKVSFTYSFLHRKLDWEQFCDLTGIDYYATRNGFEIKDEEIFYFTESKAREYELL